ncbi:hypothetical protein HK104_007367, partial [Borealophlyctis nickersoniae]
FEWAWQYPHLSRHFKSAFPNAYTGTRTELLLPTKLRVLSNMLHLDHWSRWPLRLHFLNPHVAAEFAGLAPLPPSSHIVVECGFMDTVVEKFGAEFEGTDVERVEHLAKMEMLANDTDCVICYEPVEIEV